MGMLRRDLVAFRCNICGKETKEYAWNDPELEGLYIPPGWRVCGLEIGMKTKVACPECVTKILHIANEAKSHFTAPSDVAILLLLKMLQEREVEEPQDSVSEEAPE